MVNVALTGPKPPEGESRMAECDGNMVAICIRGALVCIYHHAVRLFGDACKRTTGFHSSSSYLAKWD